MKLLRIISVAAVCAALACLAQAQSNGNANGGATPQLVVDSPVHDFGEVKAGTPLKWAFKIKNTGKADLLINSVAPS